MNTPNRAVVVGVSPDGYDAALAFATAEARRTHRGVHLIHVLEAPAGDAYIGAYGGMLDLAKATLDEAEEAARVMAGADTPVTSELVDHGWLVDDLVRHTDGASVLVLQHRLLSRVARLFTGSVAERVISRAKVPVISVPQGWNPDTAHAGLVTACVQDPAEAGLLLTEAFGEAKARGAHLQVLHAWWLSSGYDVAVVDDAMRAQETERCHERLETVLKPLQAEYPDVAVTVTVQHAPPVEAVLDAAEKSELLVLGRRHHLLPLRSHLGPVTRASLGHATCPVFVVPEWENGAAG